MLVSKQNNYRELWQTTTIGYCYQATKLAGNIAGKKYPHTQIILP